MAQTVEPSVWSFGELVRHVVHGAPPDEVLGTVTGEPSRGLNHLDRLETLGSIAPVMAEAGRAYGRLWRAAEHDGSAAVLLCRVDELLPAEYRAVVRDLACRNYGVGLIASRWGASPEALGVVVRFALANTAHAMAVVAGEKRCAGRGRAVGAPPPSPRAARGKQARGKL